MLPASCAARLGEDSLDDVASSLRERQFRGGEAGDEVDGVEYDMSGPVTEGMLESEQDLRAVIDRVSLYSKLEEETGRATGPPQVGDAYSGRDHKCQAASRNPKQTLRAIETNSAS